MSFGVDVNILLYASDGSSPLHEKATAFLEQCANGREVFCLAWLTIMSYLRMATHPSIFERPLTHDEAMRNVEALLSLPHCRVIGEEEGFWDPYRKTTADVPTRGNLVPDAHLASILAGMASRRCVPTIATSASSRSSRCAIHCSEQMRPRGGSHGRNSVEVSGVRWNHRAEAIAPGA